MFREPLRLALLGAARVTPKVALTRPDLIDVRGVAARNPARARAFAELHGLGGCYASYEAALEDPEVEAVYIASPCRDHVPWTLAALEAGKHVLAEKPFALSSRDAERAVTRAQELGLLLVEAHHSVYHPLTARFVEAVRKAGRIESVEAVFDAPIRQESDIRLDPRLGAGVLLDFGGYPFCWLEWVRGAQGGDAPRWGLSVTSAEAVCRPAEIDRTMDVQVLCQSAAGSFSARFRTSMEPECSFQARIIVRTERGPILFENPLSLEGSFLEVPGEPKVWGAGPTTYMGQLEALYRAIRDRAPIAHSGADIVALAELVDAGYRAAGLVARAELAASS
ncbi:MAG: hypothetical protein B6A08_07950 [Sorangiineae bacterium NIC37A_2]|nr:MAG: hypothetical protein B6A08_07950 [Sorangiineae bacterium NIC37A_2]